MQQDQRRAVGAAIQATVVAPALARHVIGSIAVTASARFLRSETQRQIPHRWDARSAIEYRIRAPSRRETFWGTEEDTRLSSRRELRAGNLLVAGSSSARPTIQIPGGRTFGDSLDRHGPRKNAVV
jgi:hypothetical protein